MSERIEKIPEDQLKMLRTIQGSYSLVFDALREKYDRAVAMMFIGLGIQRKVEGLKRTIDVDLNKGEIKITDTTEIIKV